MKKRHTIFSERKNWRLLFGLDFSLVLLFLLSPIFCNGQTSAKTGQHTKLIRTQGTQSGIVSCELLDSDGNLWFSINGEGVYRFDGKTFTNFTTEDGLCNNNVGPVIQDRYGNILMGTNKGICKYDGGKFTKYPVADTLSITCMLEDKDGNLWFGTRSNGVYRYDGKTLDNFLNNNDHKFNLGSNYQLILDILQDRNGNLWFSSWNGGGVWRYDGKDFKNFIPSKEYYTANQDKRNLNNSSGTLNYVPDKPYSPSQDYINDDMVFSMTEDHAGNIWFATRDHGVCRYNGETFTSMGENEGFLSRGATVILEDVNGILWFTTADNGIWSYDGKTFRNFTEKDGLINNAVMSMLQDKDGNLWFGTKWLGLSRYDGKAFTTFSHY